MALELGFSDGPGEGLGDGLEPDEDPPVGLGLGEGQELSTPVEPGEALWVSDGVAVGVGLCVGDELGEGQELSVGEGLSEAFGLAEALGPSDGPRLGEGSTVTRADPESGDVPGEALLEAVGEAEAEGVSAGAATAPPPSLSSSIFAKASVEEWKVMIKPSQPGTRLELSGSLQPVFVIRPLRVSTCFWSLVSTLAPAFGLPSTPSFTACAWELRLDRARVAASPDGAGPILDSSCRRLSAKRWCNSTSPSGSSSSASCTFSIASLVP